MDQMGRLAFPSELPGANRNAPHCRSVAILPDFADLSPKLVRDQIPPGVWPLGVARAVPHRTGASATVDADRQLAQEIIKARLPESTRNIVLLQPK